MSPVYFVKDVARPDRVLKNIVLDALELFLAADEVIVALVLPEWLSGQAKQPIGLSSRSALQPSEHNRGVDLGREQQVYMVGHKHPTVQEVITGSAAADRSNYRLRDSRQPQIARAGTFFIQQPIQAHEGFARGQTSGEVPVRRKSIMQTESD